MTEAPFDFSCLTRRGVPIQKFDAGESMFGEMALIDDGPRSAAALANEATEASAIDKAMFVQLVREEPEFALRVMRLLTERIRRMAQNR